jgi:pre-mRNA 3'-end-processing factor FIP1
MANTNMNKNTMNETLVEVLKSLVKTNATEDSDVNENIFEDKGLSSDSEEDDDIVVVNDNFTLSSMMEDLNSMGTLNGVPVHECSTEGKPWLRPYADNTDYCSYGFNEYAWLEYYEHQREMRYRESPSSSRHTESDVESQGTSYNEERVFKHLSHRHRSRSRTHEKLSRKRPSNEEWVHCGQNKKKKSD